LTLPELWRISRAQPQLQQLADLTRTPVARHRHSLYFVITLILSEIKATGWDRDYVEDTRSADKNI